MTQWVDEYRRIMLLKFILITSNLNNMSFILLISVNKLKQLVMRIISIKTIRLVSASRQWKLMRSGTSIVKTQSRLAETKELYYGEFDPGSGWTLAGGLIHASRARTFLRKADSGARVSNAYTIYLSEWDSPGKLGVIPHSIFGSHDLRIKAPVLKDECAYY